MSAAVLLAVIFVLTLLVVTWLLNQLPRYTVAAFDTIHRYSPLDGLRGILALSVFTHHFFKNYYFQTTGRWYSPNINFFTNLGSVPVSLFFLITGYLFFSKLQKPTIDWSYLYRARVQRIVPLYLFLGVSIVAIYFTQTHPPLSLSEWQHWMVRWLTFNNQSLKDFYAWPLVAGAAWTLLYEWGFYFSLPGWYLLTHPSQVRAWRNVAMLIISLPILYYVVTHTVIKLYWLFLLAFFAVWLRDFFKNLLAKFPITISLTLSLLTIVILLYTSAYSYWQIVLCAILFCFIANGFDYFGVLYQQGLRILGEFSYSLYLTHGVVMYAFFNLLNLHDFDQPMRHYVLTYPLVFVLVIACAWLSYRYIEKPFMYRPVRPTKQGLVVHA